jgi:hypothetical protein
VTIIQNLSNSLLASAALGLATSLSALSPQVAQAGAVIFNNADPSLDALLPQVAQAGAVIFNNADPSLASVALGVNGAGHLNFPNPLGFRPVNSGWTGLSYRFPDGTWRDATSPGCLCEGWGVAVTDPSSNRVAGWVNEASGSGGLTGVVFRSTTTTASSSIQLASYPVGIQHFYGVSLAPNVFQGNVTITNSGTDTVTDVVYRRVMDWDVPPTEFSEYVSHFGVASNLEPAGNVRFASNNGFATSDPRVGPGQIWLGSSINVDFFQQGPADHGSVFDFAFGDLAPGQSRTFNIFYGAAADLAGAQAAIAALDPDVWSFGQSSASGPADNSPTFLFAFGGVGGQEPGTTPQNPVLPFVPAPRVFIFPAPTPRRWFDPPFVSRFDYSLGSGEFLSFILPPGFGTTIDLYVGDTLIASDLTADGLTEYFFLSDFGLDDIAGFSLRDILPLVDAADPTAFPTFLDFTPGAGPLTMRAVESGVVVPEPNSLLGLFALGTLGAASTLKRQLKPSQSTEKETTKVG